VVHGAAVNTKYLETIKYTFFVALSRRPTSQRPILQVHETTSDRPSLVLINHCLCSLVAQIAHIARGSWRCSQHQVPRTIKYTSILHRTNPTPNFSASHTTSPQNRRYKSLLVFHPGTDSPHRSCVVHGTAVNTKYLETIKKQPFFIALSRRPTFQRPILQVHETTSDRPSLVSINHCSCILVAQIAHIARGLWRCSQHQVP
jgi:hypothetical protein